MRNRLTFANVIGVLLENKKKTYPQHQLVRSLFSAYLDDTLTVSELIADDTTMYSRWCNGARPIPIDILKTYRSYRDNIAIVKLVYPLLFAFVTLILVPSGLMTASSLPEDSYRSV